METSRLSAIKGKKKKKRNLLGIQLDEMSWDSWYRELLCWWNEFIVTAEDNELYSISLRGHTTAVSIATLVTRGGLLGTDITGCCPAKAERPVTVYWKIYWGNTAHTAQLPMEQPNRQNNVSNVQRDLMKLYVAAYISLGYIFYFVLWQGCVNSLVRKISCFGHNAKCPVAKLLSIVKNIQWFHKP